MKLDAQVVGNAGLHYVCYHLSLLGWNVMPTARNARGIDVVAYDRTGSKFIGVQVKALSKRDPVPCLLLAPAAVLRSKGVPRRMESNRAGSRDGLTSRCRRTACGCR